MFDIGGGEFLLIGLAIIILFGPKKIPEIAQMLGKGLSQLRKAQYEFQENIREIERDVQNSIENQQPAETSSANISSKIVPSSTLENDINLHNASNLSDSEVHFEASSENVGDADLTKSNQISTSNGGSDTQLSTTPNNDTIILRPASQIIPR